MTSMKMVGLKFYFFNHSQADVEESPEISLDIIAPLESTVHNQMLFHPCVQLADDVTPLINKGANTGRQYGSRKLRFCPPNNEIDLCQYKVKLHEDDIPVKAFYQMKVPNCDCYFKGENLVGQNFSSGKIFVRENLVTFVKICISTPLNLTVKIFLRGNLA